MVNPSFRGNDGPEHICNVKIVDNVCHFIFIHKQDICFTPRSTTVHVAPWMCCGKRKFSSEEIGLICKTTSNRIVLIRHRQCFGINRGGRLCKGRKHRRGRTRTRTRLIVVDATLGGVLVVGIVVGFFFCPTQYFFNALHMQFCQNQIFIISFIRHR